MSKDTLVSNSNSYYLSFRRGLLFYSMVDEVFYAKLSAMCLGLANNVPVATTTSVVFSPHRVNQYLICYTFQNAKEGSLYQAFYGGVVTYNVRNKSFCFEKYVGPMYFEFVHS